MLTLRWHPQPLAVCRLAASGPLPDWVTALLGVARPDASRPLTAVIRTADELTVIAAADAVASGIEAERDFIACQVVGPLDFTLVGVLRRLSSALADANIPLLAVSTFETDWLLVRAGDASRAAMALGAVALFENAPPSVSAD